MNIFFCLLSIRSGSCPVGELLIYSSSLVYAPSWHIRSLRPKRVVEILLPLISSAKALKALILKPCFWSFFFFAAKFKLTNLNYSHTERVFSPPNILFTCCISVNLRVYGFQSITPSSTYMQQRFTQKHSLLPHHRNVNAVSCSHCSERNPASHQRRRFLQKMARRKIHTHFYSTGVTKATLAKRRVKVLWRKQLGGINGADMLSS